MRTAHVALLAALALGCGGPAPPTVVIAPASVSPAAGASQAAPGPLPACAPGWLDLVPEAREEWGRVETEDPDVSRWEGVWTKGEPRTCSFVIAIRRDRGDLIVYAN